MHKSSMKPKRSELIQTLLLCLASTLIASGLLLTGICRVAYGPVWRGVLDLASALILIYAIHYVTFSEDE